MNPTEYVFYEACSIYMHSISIADMKMNNGYLKSENYSKFFFEAHFENSDGYK